METNQKDQILNKLLRSEIFLPFALRLLNYKIVFTDNVPFGAPVATDFKRIFINPNDSFYTHQTVSKTSIMTFSLLHEICHIFFRHDDRQGSRDEILWRYATDFAINFFLHNLEKEARIWDSQGGIVKMNIMAFSDKILFDPRFENMLEEEIYDELEQGEFSKQEKSISYSDFLSQAGISNEVSEDEEIKITKTELKLGDKTFKKTFVDFPESDVPSDSESEQIEQETQLAKTLLETTVLARGCESVAFQKYLNRMFGVTVNWETILRDSIATILQKSTDISYSTPRMVWLTNPNMPYLPNYTEEEKLGTVVFLIDESGSVPDSAITAAVNIIQESKEYFKNIFVIKHDTTHSWEKWYEEITDKDIDELLVRQRSGGTSHKEPFERVVEIAQRPDVDISMILCVTDLFSDIPEAQNILPIYWPRVYLINTDTYAQMDEIIGKKIQVT